ALGVKYDGSSYSGFQRQADANTVQAELEKSLSSIAAEPITIHAAGRTDRGVHATQQVVSFETSAERPEKAWVVGANSLLPDTVGIVWLQEVSADFHARYSALWRRYLYVFGHRTAHQVFLRDLVSWTDVSLDVDRIEQVVELFLGEQDFSSLQAAHCTSPTPFRHVYHLEVIEIGKFVLVDIAANAFLLHMVRNLATVLHDVGNGALSRGDVVTLLRSRDRSVGPPTARAEGLYLTAVGYEEGFNIDNKVRIPAILGDITNRFQPVTLPCDYYRRSLKP
ncbi:MAG: tRNA pseudouridine(38-40) synthase TruA, partial [Gammaproteobacteria bacterium]|nr:tRNA pseudouridine(38-40) synthase TruA [Gammaproteobacteria bacterium]